MLKNKSKIHIIASITFFSWMVLHQYNLELHFTQIFIKRKNKKIFKKMKPLLTAKEKKEENNINYKQNA